MSRTIRPTSVLLALATGIGLTLAACDRMPTDAGANVRGSKALRDSSADSTTCKSGWTNVNGFMVCGDDGKNA